MKKILKFNFIFLVLLIVTINIFASTPEASKTVVTSSLKLSQNRLIQAKKKKYSVQLKKNAALVVRAKLHAVKKQNALKFKKNNVAKNKNALKAKSKLLKLKILALENQIRLVSKKNNLKNKVLNTKRTVKINQKKVLAAHVKKANNLKRSFDPFVEAITEKYNN